MTDATSRIRHAHEIATIRAADDDAARLEADAMYALLWFCGTGRSFVGVERAVARLSGPSWRAFVKRIVRGMQAAAEAKRGATKSIVTGDLDNGIIARAFGHASVEAAAIWACELPYVGTTRLAA